MSFKATVDMFVNFSYLQVRCLNRQGYLRYRMKIFMRYNNSQVPCHPYNIVKGPTPTPIILPTPPTSTSPTSSSPTSPCSSPKLQPSQIDNNSLHYYSQTMPISNRSSNYDQNQTISYKCYINTDLLQQIEYFCTIECMFTSNLQLPMEVVGKFQAKIRRMYNLSTFLPVVFDLFEGFMIFSTFHATVLEFRFLGDDFQTFLGADGGGRGNGGKGKGKGGKGKGEVLYDDFFGYLDYVTNQFDRKEVLLFYEYYRNFLIQENDSIQTRHSQLLQKISKQPHSKSQQSQLLLSQSLLHQTTILPNPQLLTLITGTPSPTSPTSSPSVSSPLAPQTKDIIVQMILKDYSLVKGHLYKKWLQFMKFVIRYSKYIAKCMRKEYQMLCRDRYKSNVFSHCIRNFDWRYARYEDNGVVTKQLAFEEKKKGIADEELWKEHFPIQNMAFFGKSQNNIKIFEQVYLPQSTSLSSSSSSSTTPVLSSSHSLPSTTTLPSSKTLPSPKARHIIILVHGFQASRQDFLLLKNCLQITYGVHVIISTCNEGLTQNSILAAGRRLANQVKKLLGLQVDEFRVSFVGHSMGGLIVRAAMGDLKEFWDRMFCYVSFSSPHLGYLYDTSVLVKAGIWFLSSWHKIEAVKQLCMKDNQNLRQTVLYKLSSTNSLHPFKKLCLLTSCQDHYVPYSSSRIQLNPSLLSQMPKKSQQILQEMVNNIINSIQCTEISRINVVFNIDQKIGNFDSFVGRTGHVKFLSDVQFIRQFVACFEKLFV